MLELVDKSTGNGTEMCFNSVEVRTDFMDSLTKLLLVASNSCLTTVYCTAVPNIGNF